MERVLKNESCDLSFPSEKNVLGNSDMKQLAVSDTCEDNLVFAIISLSPADGKGQVLIKMKQEKKKKEKRFRLTNATLCNK